jgi:spore germination cell wall hydrolase CwlJ-like protein
MVKTGMFTQPQEVKEVKTTWTQRTVHQFSWVGQRVPKIKPDDPRWIESRRIAEELSRGGYKEYQLKYGDAMNFHAVYVKPGWRLPRIGRVGNHIFYENPPKIGG